MKKTLQTALPLWGLFGALALLIVQLAANDSGGWLLAVGAAAALYFFARTQTGLVRGRRWMARMDTLVLAVVLVWVVLFSFSWDSALIQQYGLVRSLGHETDLGMLVVISLLAASLGCFAQKDLTPVPKS